MNLFTFHYITNYTLSNYQDCSLSFEVGLQDTHTIQIGVWCSVHNRDWEKNAVKCPFKQPSEHPQPLRDTSYLGIVALSLRWVSHREVESFREVLLPAFTLHVWCHCWDVDGVHKAMLSHTEASNRSIVAEGSTSLWEWWEMRVKGMGKSIC